MPLVCPGNIKPESKSSIYCAVYIIKDDINRITTNKRLKIRG